MFVCCQVLYHRSWYRAVDAACSSLGCSLLVKHPDVEDQYLVNLDPQIMELLQEAKHLQKMNLEVNDATLALCQQEAHIMSIRDSCVSALSSSNHALILDNIVLICDIIYQHSNITLNKLLSINKQYYMCI